MKKTTLFITIIVVAFIIGAAYLSIGKVENTLKIGNPALKLMISTGTNESDGSPIITNVTFEQTRVIYKGTDSQVVFPDINVMLRNETTFAEPVTYWASEPWVKGKDKYPITLTFRDSYKPKTGDFLILTIRFTGTNGEILGKKTAFYDWQ